VHRPILKRFPVCDDGFLFFEGKYVFHKSHIVSRNCKRLLYQDDSTKRLVQWTNPKNTPGSFWSSILKSSRSYNYHTVFLCVKSGFKRTFPHKKRSHFPLVNMKFVVRIGSHPQHLTSDKACEINCKKFDSLLLAKAVNTSVFQMVTITL
jgi:hypothetical protein